MPDRQTELASAIESVVGGENLTQASITIDGVRPSLIAKPKSAVEVAACLRVCAELNAAVAPAGLMTWLECGNPLRRADVVLSLQRMRGIVEYSPPDLTATVEAGLALSDFTVVTVAERQWLPIDPPGFRSASLGAIAACNSSGALRLGFGTPRDYVIGLRVAHADGTQSKSGGRVVKNVAGYDLNKLYVGSYGTLAIITELTFKLRPLAECSATMMITAKSRAPLLRLADRVLASHLQPASVVFTRRILTRLSPMGPDETLLIRFIDSDPAVEHQMDWVVTSIDAECQARVLDESEAVEVWTEAADFQATGIQVKISVPLSEVTAVLEKVLAAHSESVASADLGAGIIRMEFDADERDASGQIKRLRVVAGAAGGTLFVEKAPAEVRRKADAWGAVGSSEQLMLSMKQRFDPQALLNPGKFVLSI